MASQRKDTLCLNFCHINEFNEDLANIIVMNFIRVEPFIRLGAQKFIHHVMPELISRSDGTENIFFVSVFNALTTCVTMRRLRAEMIGILSSFVGTVIRTSEVRPVLFLGTFRCGVCNNFVRYLEQNFYYTTPSYCSNPNCVNNKMWNLMREDSKYCDWQKIRVQELSDEMITGSIPHTLDVILRADAVETVRPGDNVLFTGALIVIPNILITSESKIKFSKVKGIGGTGIFGVNSHSFKRMGMQEFSHRLAFLSSHVKLKTSEASDSIYGKIEQKEGKIGGLSKIEKDKKIFENLAISFAPHVYGHIDVKMSILLMLVGGLHKTTKEGVPLRSDINILIVGDPSSAKSQILKYVTQLVPRSVYTSGKGSSAAGLTASVVKDSDTNEYVLEPGALMLADNSVCCIDEFDKMNEKDRVAIHEAMEQQTISISKAGIQATLNARTSILAAANPWGGRYDKSHTLVQNLNISAPIISRFDLIHVILDEPDETVDLRLAEHIIKIHRYQSDSINAPYTKDDLYNYIQLAKSYRPNIGFEARKVMVYAYRRMRGDIAAVGIKNSVRITVRQLEALIRLSEALTRIHRENVIKPRHVRVAVKLLLSSIQSLESEDLILEDEETNKYSAESSIVYKEKINPLRPLLRTTKANSVNKNLISGSKYTMISQFILNKLKKSIDIKEDGIKQELLVDWIIKDILFLKLIRVENTAHEINIVLKVIRKLIKQDMIVASLPDVRRNMNETDEEYYNRLERTKKLRIV
jgi:DNA replication licensing factor MCM6